MKSDKFSLTGLIVSGAIIYDDETWKSKLNKFKQANEGGRVTIDFINSDSPAHGLHRYFRGYLLPDIATAYGERDTEYVHRYILKKDFLFMPIESLDEIKGRHRDRPTIYVKEINEKITVVGYAPSTGDISHEDMKEFVLKCEHRLFIDLAGHIGQSVSGEELTRYSGEAKKFRDQGMGVVDGQAELFG